MTTTYIGIDPGKSGSIATITSHCNTRCDIIQILDLDITTICIASFLKNIEGNKLVVLERVHAMPIWWGGSEDKTKPTKFIPKQGIASTFKFGESYGKLKGILETLEISYKEVLARVWQKQMNCLTKGDKKVTHKKAKQLFPEIANKITHKNADALLIAKYCQMISFDNIYQ